MKIELISGILAMMVSLISANGMQDAFSQIFKNQVDKFQNTLNDAIKDHGDILDNGKKNIEEIIKNKEIEEFKKLEKKCPNAEIVKDWDSQAYLGEWFELYRSKDSPLEDGQCTHSEYS